MSRRAPRLVPTLIEEDEAWLGNADAGTPQDVHALLRYALNVHRAVEPASDEAGALIAWLARNRERLGLPYALFVRSDVTREPESRHRPVGRERWDGIAKVLEERLDERAPERRRRKRRQRAADVAPADGPLDSASAVTAGLAAVTAALGFDPLDSALFGIVFRYGTDSHFERLFDGLARARGRLGVLRRYPDLFALLLDASATEISRRFRADAPLVASGAIRIDEDGDIQLAARLRGLVHACAEGGRDARTELLGPAVAANLPLEAFRHLGTEIDVALRVLRAALEGREKGRAEHGVHILLYGPPGTGKTECAASLAAELGVALHVIGEQSDSGREPSRGERLSELLLAQRIGAQSPGLYLFDEAEDLFRPRLFDREPDPKIFVHRLLENAAVPMIWAANDLDAFSSAVLRRMAMCIEVRLPAQGRRAELWQELAAKEGVALDAETARRLARVIPAAPSVARTALRATRLAAGDAATAELVAGGMARAIGHGRMAAPEPAIEADYDPALSHADTDLATIADRLARPTASHAISLLLAGPPGTGKSAFARHLADRMGLPVLQKRGSDLFGPFVGQTEAMIADAFAEARATQSFLIFDEADSLLFSRDSAHRGFEISQVNEMLTWMESHPYPFACTTNLAEKLDAASFRRFLVRVTFRFLTPSQAAELFRRRFGCEPPPRLAAFDRLTPADFSRIARRIEVLGIETTPESLLGMLESELEGREGAKRAIGFGGRSD